MRTSNQHGSSAAPPGSQRGERFGTLSLGVVFSLFPLLIYLPASIYLSNTGEFTLRPADLLAIFLPAFLFSLAVGTALVAILPALLRRHAVALTYAIGLLFWLQGSILVWHYGVFDGRDIQWEAYRVNGLIDSPIWVAFIAVSLLVPAAFIRLCRPAAMIILGVQSALLIYSFAAEVLKAEEPGIRSYAIDYSNKFSYSDKLNVILIVLDAYQSDVFQQIVTEDPEYASSLKGFTYFRDAVAGSNFTELAIPALVTGKVYDNSVPRGDFVRDAYLHDSIMARLKQAGFVVDIYPWVGWGNESIFLDTRIASNLVVVDDASGGGSTFSEKNAKEALHLLDLSIFRAAPHFLKRFVFNDNRWFIAYFATFMVPEGVKQVVSTDDKFTIGAMVKEMPVELSVQRGEKVFKYYHLSGVHSPLSADQDRNFSSEVFPFNRTNYVRQAQANLKYLAKFLGKLEAKGIYDSSLIVVVGDHGSGESPEMYVDVPGASTKPFHLEGTNRNFRRDKARALPLVLIKPPGAGGALTVSQAPVALTSIPATILGALGLPEGAGGSSMFDIDESAIVVRYHSAFDFSPNKTEYVDDITVYKVVGDSWLNESWSVSEIRQAAQVP